MQLATFNLVSGLVLHILFGLMVIRIKHWKGMELYAFAFPFYWVLHMFASFRAIWQLVRAPHHWDKTEHGLTRMLPGTASKALDKGEAIG